eukprot:CAMPEP_0202347116 /NCGR_PEP_ID=MMETSP1126-20121109/5619_1 /ASSEMBLY_ACC=CAM_ASM_000457 /TAXON_ID=3047 /ORGANISM="Dunaliella tertiolecta, Strain CCMP1320" /LENGTH=373 /DNA_ID=CAMNT_0048938627 /DNA_START=709 /DNA_END=1828 /DNA_ORIENTATION=+
MEIEQLVRQLQQKVDELNQVVLQLRQQQQQQQEDGRATRGSVDQLVRDSADTNWAAACSIDREERQKFYSVRLLRSRNAGALPCEATPAGVEAFLQCEVGSVQHVERMRDNALGKQRYIVRFSTAEAATAAYAGFRDSSNAAQALLVQKKTRLQNALVDLAIQLQQLGRGQCGYGEELVVQVRGKAIVVKLGEGELVPYPFRQHLPSGRIPSPGEPFLHLNAGRLGQQLKQLLKPPSPSQQQQQQQQQGQQRKHLLRLPHHQHKQQQQERQQQERQQLQQEEPQSLPPSGSAPTKRPTLSSTNTTLPQQQEQQHLYKKCTQVALEEPRGMDKLQTKRPEFEHIRLRRQYKQHGSLIGGMGGCMGVLKGRPYPV